MSALLWRALLAVIAVVLLFALLPLLLRIFALSIGGDVLSVIRICIGGIALLWVLTGKGGPTVPGA